MYCRPITRDCMVTELHKAMQRSSYLTVCQSSYSYNEIILDGFFTPLLSPLDCRSGVERANNTEVLNYCGHCALKLNIVIYLQPMERLV